MRSFFICVILFTFFFYSEAQISNGGRPRDVIKVKSREIPLYQMPFIDNNLLLKNTITEYDPGIMLKPLKFAHSFQVGIDLIKDGYIGDSRDGYKIYQLHIKSEGAFSLNLILDPYYIPPGSRLFIYDPKMNTILGAFTDYNNKSYKTLAISPVAGDEIIIHYEEPGNASYQGEIGIKTVNHDFLGVVKSTDERRPLGILSGECNIDINCELAEKWETIKNSVCRIFVDGTELCSGALINNTSEDGTPYVLTAEHCFSSHINGEQNSVFLFNYESPYCGSIDGDITNSISGSEPVACFDSLDFSLVELTLIPPPEYRPYYAGWDVTDEIPDSVVCIHHPQGDIKKIAIDNDSPVKTSFRNGFLQGGFWRTFEWDYGTTEAGSSGGPYFNNNMHIIGTLTGGIASCGNSVDDYFERLGLSWDYLTDINKQLKQWLDPLNTGIEVLDGYNPYEGENLCDAFTNLYENDTHDIIIMNNQNEEFSGYMGGTNTLNVTEYAEKFSFAGDVTLSGVSLGIGKNYISDPFNPGEITLNVYEGSDSPESKIYSKIIDVNELVEDAMNFVSFDETIKSATDNFFVAFDLSEIPQQDTLVFYMTLRQNNDYPNTVSFKQNNQWHDLQDIFGTEYSASLLLELIVCNIEELQPDTIDVTKPVNLSVYPNPVHQNAYLKINREITGNDISVFDILGKKVNISVNKINKYEFEIDLPQLVPGIYIINVQNNKISASYKISIPG